MRKLSRLFSIATLFSVLLCLAACGNKGELFRESEATAEELEEAAKKLEKLGEQSEGQNLENQPSEEEKDKDEDKDEDKENKDRVSNKQNKPTLDSEQAAGN